jgi:hypothetical protein
MSRTNTEKASLFGRIAALSTTSRYKSVDDAYKAAIVFEEFDDTVAARNAFEDAYSDPCNEREEQRRWKLANNAYEPDSTYTDPEANR